MKRCAFTVAVLLAAASLQAQVTIDSSMDWESGIYRLSASMPLENGISPGDHPKAIEKLERELSAVVVRELSAIQWDNMGSIADLVERRPEMRTSLESLADRLRKDWSRITPDYSAAEASFTLDLSDAVSEAFPPPPRLEPLPDPLGWQPVPTDSWTGIVIYVPDGLPLRGTGLTADYTPALRLRILSDSLRVLSQPAAAGTGIPAYLRIEDRALAEEMVGRRPYRTMARGLYGESPCDIILSEEDTIRILASESGRQALSEGNIVLLVDDISG